jgi:invasion protein IalB
MPFSPTRLWAALLIGSLVLPDAAFAQAKKPAAPAHPAAAPAAPATPAPAPAEPVPAQAAPTGQPGGPVQVDLLPTQNTWTKVCGKDQAANKEICYTTRDFGVKPEQGPILAVAVYDVKGDDTRIVRLLLPIGLMLRPGFRFAVDANAPIEGAFEICFPNGCFAEAKVKGPTIDSLKKGKTLLVSVRNQVNSQVDFHIPLANFGEAFDGPPIDPKVLEEQQKKLQEELQKRAEEERKRLEAAQPAPAAAPASPPAAPAAPATTPPK